LAAALIALPVLCSQFALPVSAKTPGTRYCFSGWCHRVGTLAQTETLVGWRGYLLASFYDDCRHDRLNPCGLTSSGSVFRSDLPDNAASPLFPDGTIILAYNPKTGDASVLRITNAGPYSGERKLDVSRAGADSLGFKDAGVAHLVVSVLKSPTIQEASYVKYHVYQSVPGHLGKFETFDLAYAAATQKLKSQLPVTADSMAEPDLESGRAFQDELIVKPRPAVSPYFARELVMLRVPPRPVTRTGALDHDRGTSDTAASPGTEFSFGYGLRKFLAAPEAETSEVASQNLAKP
jgi:peptidoglycan lytic transglycosylase